ncbi:MAG: hypothetical protein ABI761_14685 [Saprospiraceae bacterium]
MSKFVLFLLLAAMNTGLMASVPLTAAEIPVHISATSKWLIVDKSNWKASKIEVSIKKADGTILIQEDINESKKYNLKNLPVGSYTLELEDAQQVRIQNLEVSRDMMYSTNITTVYKPHLIFNTDNVAMNLMTQGHSATVTITNSEGKTIFSENIVDEVSATRKYNLKDVPAGDYSIQVYIAGQQFSKSFSK